MEEVRQPQVRSGLTLRFLNVGDGDSIFIEERSPGKSFRMLVDTGRSTVDQPDPCLSCAEHLQRMGIRRLDLLMVTHLHEDHAGGLEEVARRVEIGELVSTYIPERPERRLRAEPDSPRTVQGMIACLNRWSQDVRRLTAYGSRITEVDKTMRNIWLTDRLTADWIVPDCDAMDLQRRVWDRMQGGDALAVEKKIAASKLRNPNSMRVRLRYAGREIVLAADCYGHLWDSEALMPCDLLKVPHHGDAKALTGALVSRLRPAHAVISCGREYIPDKDRPSAKTIGLLRSCGTRIWYTDAFSDGMQPPRSWPYVEFSIHEDGKLVAPASGGLCAGE